MPTRPLILVCLGVLTLAASGETKQKSLSFTPPGQVDPGDFKGDSLSGKRKGASENSGSAPSGGGKNEFNFDKKMTPAAKLPDTGSTEETPKHGGDSAGASENGFSTDGDGSTGGGGGGGSSGGSGGGEDGPNSLSLRGDAKPPKQPAPDPSKLEPTDWKESDQKTRLAYTGTSNPQFMLLGHGGEVLIPPGQISSVTIDGRSYNNGDPDGARLLMRNQSSNDPWQASARARDGQVAGGNYNDQGPGMGAGGGPGFPGGP